MELFCAVQEMSSRQGNGQNLGPDSGQLVGTYNGATYFLTRDILVTYILGKPKTVVVPVGAATLWVGTAANSMTLGSTGVDLMSHHYVTFLFVGEDGTSDGTLFIVDEKTYDQIRFNKDVTFVPIGYIYFGAYQRFQIRKFPDLPGCIPFVSPKIPLIWKVNPWHAVNPNDPHDPGPSSFDNPPARNTRGAYSDVIVHPNGRKLYVCGCRFNDVGDFGSGDMDRHPTIQAVDPVKRTVDVVQDYFSHGNSNDGYNPDWCYVQGMAVDNQGRLHATITHAVIWDPALQAIGGNFLLLWDGYIRRVSGVERTDNQSGFQIADLEPIPPGLPQRHPWYDQLTGIWYNFSVPGGVYQAVAGGAFSNPPPGIRQIRIVAKAVGMGTASLNVQFVSCDLPDIFPSNNDYAVSVGVAGPAPTSTPVSGHGTNFDTSPGTVPTTSTHFANLGLSLAVDNVAPYFGETVIAVFTLTNAGNSDAGHVKILCDPPEGVAIASFSKSVGTYDLVTRLWEIDTVNSGGGGTLTLHLIVNTTARYVFDAQPPVKLTARIQSSDVVDSDTTDNGVSILIQPDFVPARDPSLYTSLIYNAPQNPFPPFDGLSIDLYPSVSIDNIHPLIGELITFRVSLSNNAFSSDQNWLGAEHVVYLVQLSGDGIEYQNAVFNASGCRPVVKNNVDADNQINATRSYFSYRPPSSVVGSGKNFELLTNPQTMFYDPTFLWAYYRVDGAIFDLKFQGLKPYFGPEEVEYLIRPWALCTDKNGDVYGTAFFPYFLGNCVQGEQYSRGRLEMASVVFKVNYPDPVVTIIAGQGVSTDIIPNQLGLNQFGEPVQAPFLPNTGEFPEYYWPTDSGGGPGNGMTIYVVGGWGYTYFPVDSTQSHPLGDGGLATDATLRWPRSLTFDKDNNMYISDSVNQRIRKVDMTSGYISTVVGTGVKGFSGDKGLATAAQLNNPWGIHVNHRNELLISDAGNFCIRTVNLDAGADAIIDTFCDLDTLPGDPTDGDKATKTHIWEPRGLTTDKEGNLYLATGGGLYRLGCKKPRGAPYNWKFVT